MTDRLQFTDWLADRLGTRLWVVAPRLTPSLARKGIALAISQDRFKLRKAEYVGALHYRVASGLTGARRWRVTWRADPADEWHHSELVDDRGNVVRFGSMESAQKRADRLNLSGITPEPHPTYGRYMPRL